MPAQKFQGVGTENFVGANNVEVNFPDKAVNDSDAPRWVEKHVAAMGVADGVKVTGGTPPVERGRATEARRCFQEEVHAVRDGERRKGGVGIIATNEAREAAATVASASKSKSCSGGGAKRCSENATPPAANGASVTVGVPNAE